MKRTLTTLLIAAAPALTGAQTFPDDTTPYSPITASQRVDWVVKSTLAPTTLLFTAFDAGLGTLRNSPPELGTHVTGFGERYGLHVADRALSTGLEAGVGSLWGEDPRYRRVPEKSFSGRIGNVFRMTVVSHDSSGREMPAYARLIAVPSAAFISNAWKPDSQNSTVDALNRIGFSVATHILANAYLEFWPDVKVRIFHHRQDPTSPLSDPDAASVR
jgi:hypothetical protein